MNKKIYCGGLFCRKSDRKKCVKCGVWVCGGCRVKIKNKIYCLDCGLIPFLKDDLGKELKKFGF